MIPQEKLDKLTAVIALQELYLLFLLEYNVDPNIVSFSIEEVNRIIESKIKMIWES